MSLRAVYTSDFSVQPWLTVSAVSDEGTAKCKQKLHTSFQRPAFYLFYSNGLGSKVFRRCCFSSGTSASTAVLTSLPWPESSVVNYILHTVKFLHNLQLRKLFATSPTPWKPLGRCAAYKMAAVLCPRDDCILADAHTQRWLGCRINGVLHSNQDQEKLFGLVLHRQKKKKEAGNL